MGRPPAKQAEQSITLLSFLVVVTFFNHNFVNSKAILMLDIKNLRNNIQYKTKWCTHRDISITKNVWYCGYSIVTETKVLAAV